RRSVQDLGDVGKRDAGQAAGLIKPAQDADRLVLRGGGGLGAVGAARPLVNQQHVGEGAADVNAKSIGHRASQESESRGQITPAAVSLAISLSPRPSRPR